MIARNSISCALTTIQRNTVFCLESLVLNTKCELEFWIKWFFRFFVTDEFNL